MTDNIIIKQLTPSDIFPNLLKSFKNKQIITNKWVKDDNGYRLEKAHEVREWNAEKRVWVSEYLTEQINRGGYAAAAYCGDKIIGFASLDGKLETTADNNKYVNLTMLFVDEDWRRTGIGRKLLMEIFACAEKMGADKVFISAIPSLETIAFYFSIGCSDAEFVIESFVDTEEDRYLEYVLKKNQRPLDIS